MKERPLSDARVYELLTHSGLERRTMSAAWDAVAPRLFSSWMTNGLSHRGQPDGGGAVDDERLLLLLRWLDDDFLLSC